MAAVEINAAPLSKAAPAYLNQHQLLSGSV